MNRFEELYRILNEWMYLHEEGKKLSDILLDKGVNSIAIYGIGDCAIHLIKECMGTDLRIECLIVDDKSEYDISLPIVKKGEEIRNVDCIVSTVPMMDVEAKKLLSEMYCCKVVTLADAVFEMI